MLYSWLVLPLMIVLAWLIGRKNEKVRLSMQGRQGVWERIELAMAQRDWNQPLVWFHVASAGEFLQSQPVIERLHARGVQTAITCTSINGMRWLQKAKFHQNRRPLLMDYLPLDTDFNARRFLGILQPKVSVWVKFDLWPNYIWNAHQLGIGLFLISATLQPFSRRHNNLLGRWFFSHVYRCFNGIFTVHAEDTTRFAKAVPDHPNLRLLGDTRFDSVLDRRERLATPNFPEWLAEKFVFIVGSCWPPDESLIFPALSRALEQHDDLILILAPHEPSEAHLVPIENAFKKHEPVRFTQWDQAEDRQRRVILLDTVGKLSSFYRVGHLAYVGGAFTTGVHNIMEPCAMGLSVFFGPKHHNSPEAVDMSARGLVFSVDNTELFEAKFLELIQQPQAAARLGQAAREVIESQSGAADQCFQEINKELE